MKIEVEYFISLACKIFDPEEIEDIIQVMHEIEADFDRLGDHQVELNHEIAQLTLIEYDKINGGQDLRLKHKKPPKLLQNQPKIMTYRFNSPNSTNSNPIDP